MPKVLDLVKAFKRYKQKYALSPFFGPSGVKMSTTAYEYVYKLYRLL